MISLVFILVDLMFVLLTILMLLTAILVVTLVLLIRPEMLQVDIGYFSMIFTGMSKDLKIMISGIRGNTLIVIKECMIIKKKI
jgi:hypothetical protein